MSIRIVTLSENTVCAGRYLAEWGLSILVETEKVKVLLRLLDNHENIETACSKAGLNVEVTKKFLFL